MGVFINFTSCQLDVVFPYDWRKCAAELCELSKTKKACRRCEAVTSAQLICNQRIPLKKARYLWQIKNRRKRRKFMSSVNEKDTQKKLISCSHSLKYHQSIDDVDIISDSQSSESNLKVIFNAKSEDFECMDDNSQTTKLDPKEFEPNKVWSQSRGSPVGILLKSMDEVAVLAQKQDFLVNMNPHLLKYYMKGIAENSVNNILEATGTAPGGKPSKKYLLNQEELEDEAVSEVIRQHGIQAARYSRQKSKPIRCKDEHLNEDDGLKSDSISSNEEDTTLKAKESYIENATSVECQIDSPSECMDMTQVDLLDAAVSFAIGDKGLGFLLTRTSIEKPNTCSSVCKDIECPFLKTITNSVNYTGYCKSKVPVDKVVILLIDGLYFDFIDIPNRVNVNSVEKSNRFKIKVFNEFLANDSNEVSVYKFMADPPTTTMQRLKGLMTGSLPTFIDIGNNFASEEIKEDSLIHQMVSSGKKLVFMGDDTWMDLFPKKFFRYYPFPSFNVKDLDTVDDGIMEKLFPEFQKTDWDVMIAHFLGVDHCGHTFGRNNVAMDRKLKQMNDIIDLVMNEMNKVSDDILLVVMGDHGMTLNGDHGGDSTDEITSSLVLYRNNHGIVSKNNHKNIIEVPQVSFVPTLSIILGLPIPFGNTGSILPDISYRHFINSATNQEFPDLYYLLASYEINIDQINRYLGYLVETTSDFPKEAYQALNLQLKATLGKANLFLSNSSTFKYEEVDNLKSILNGYTSYLEAVRSLCVENWARFDMVSVFFGVSLSLFSILSSFLHHFLNSKSVKELETTFTLLNSILIWLVVISNIVFYTYYRNTSTILLYTGMFSCFIYLVRENLKMIPHLKVHLPCSVSMDVIFILSVISYFLSSFSNSFIIHEAKICSFFAASLIFLSYVCPKLMKSMNVPNSGTSRSKIEHISFLLQNTFVICILLLCLRCGELFYKCREEQGPECITSSFIRPLSSFEDDTNLYRKLRYGASCLVGFSIFISIRQFLRSAGNLNGFSFSILVLSNLLVLTPVCFVLTWAIQLLPHNFLKQMPPLVESIVPLILCFVVIINLVSLCFQPLMVYHWKDSSEELQNFSRNVDPVKQIFHHLKINWKTHFASTAHANQKVVVYGLATVYSAGSIAFFMSIFTVLVLLAGDGLIFPFGLMVVVIGLVVILESFNNHSSNSKDSRISMNVIVIWMFLCNHFFFSTGHQHTFSSIHLDSAFVLWKGNYISNIFPAVFILLDTFSSQIVFTVALPLLTILPPALKTLYPKLLNANFSKRDDEEMGDYTLHQVDGSEFASYFIYLFRTWILLHAFKLCGVMTAAAILSRHLMVWKIFAPRFMFEAVSVVIITVSSACTLLFILRINTALQKWTKNLRNSKTE
ncbi:GPI ethanolamine phosphate transferase 3 [Nymphon striatum]|nr:GPI ethanolamine phosphate transferase 3 [Nymphon striatum]